ncbi:hypothetical protein F4809DRAFT_173729 [Biscogniauxia mediterranea]|nr:hypothetical protein F4809DRAFT_173729 [Biscogniauxia mediterranea]
MNRVYAIDLEGRFVRSMNKCVYLMLSSGNYRYLGRRYLRVHYTMSMSAPQCYHPWLRTDSISKHKRYFTLPSHIPPSPSTESCDRCPGKMSQRPTICFFSAVAGPLLYIPTLWYNRTRSILSRVSFVYVDVIILCFRM